MRIAFISRPDDTSVQMEAQYAERKGHHVIIWEFIRNRWLVKRPQQSAIPTGLPRSALLALFHAWQPDQIIAPVDMQYLVKKMTITDEIIYPDEEWFGRYDASIDVSVITPTLNAAHVIAPCLESVARQERIRFEHVIVDGGSTDHTHKIIQATNHPISWQSEKDSGIADAFNKGILRAKGRYLIFIGADDRLHPRALVNLRDHLKSVPSAGFVHGGCNYVIGTKFVLRGSANLAYRKQLPIRMGVIHPTVMAKRELFSHAGLFKTQLRFAMDHDLVLRWDRCGVAGIIHKHVVTDISLGGISTRQVIKARKESAQIAILHGLPSWQSYAFCALDSIRPIARNLCRTLLGRKNPVDSNAIGKQCMGTS